jgi:hypothetical protein
MISKETRYRAVVHYTHFLRSLRKVSAIYKVSKSSLQRWTSQDLNVVHAKRRRRSIFQKVESIMKDTIWFKITMRSISTKHFLYKEQRGAVETIFVLCTHILLDDAY